MSTTNNEPVDDTGTISQVIKAITRLVLQEVEAHRAERRRTYVNPWLSEIARNTRYMPATSSFQEAIIRKVVDAWDKAASTGQYDECRYADFCEAGGIEPLRALLTAPEGNEGGDANGTHT